MRRINFVCTKNNKNAQCPFNLSQFSHDDDVVERTGPRGRAIVVPRREDRNCSLSAAGWRLVHGWKWATSWPHVPTAHAFPCARARLAQPRERHVCTPDETTDQTKCRLSLPLKMCGLDVGEGRDAYVPGEVSRHGTVSMPPPKVYSSSARARSSGQSHPGRARPGRLRPTHARVAGDRARVRGRAAKLGLHSPPQAASSAAAPSFLRPLGLLRFPPHQINYCQRLSGVKCAILDNARFCTTHHLYICPLGRRHRVRHAAAGFARRLWHYCSPLANSRISHHSHESSFRPATRTPR